MVPSFGKLRYDFKSLVHWYVSCYKIDKYWGAHGKGKSDEARAQAGKTLD